MTSSLFMEVKKRGQLLEDLLTAVAYFAFFPTTPTSTFRRFTEFVVNSRFYLLQTTWSSFNTMLRIYKLYDFPYTLDGTSNERVPAVRTAFSSSPGWINSGDDFYVLSSGLVVQETTIGLNIAAFYLQSIHFRQAMTTLNCTNTSFRPVSLSGFAMFSPTALPTMVPSGLRFTRNKTAAHTTTRV